jgi:hypothetical protein
MVNKVASKLNEYMDHHVEEGIYNSKSEEHALLYFISNRMIMKNIVALDYR